MLTMLLELNQLDDVRERLKPFTGTKIDGSEEKDRGQAAGLEQRPANWQKRRLHAGSSETDSKRSQGSWCRRGQGSGSILDGDRYHAAWRADRFAANFGNAGSPTTAH